MTKTKFYIGLNDKDSHVQEIGTIDAYKIVSRVACDILGFGTITEAKGIYTHEDGTVVMETTMVLEYNGEQLDDAKMRKICETLKTVLNQESILTEETEIKSRFI